MFIEIDFKTNKCIWCGCMEGTITSQENIQTIHDMKSMGHRCYRTQCNRCKRHMYTHAYQGANGGREYCRYMYVWDYVDSPYNTLTDKHWEINNGYTPQGEEIHQRLTKRSRRCIRENARVRKGSGREDKHS